MFNLFWGTGQLPTNSNISNDIIDVHNSSIGENFFDDASSDQLEKECTSMVNNTSRVREVCTQGNSGAISDLVTMFRTTPAVDIGKRSGVDDFEFRLYSFYKNSRDRYIQDILVSDPSTTVNAVLEHLVEQTTTYKNG